MGARACIFHRDAPNVNSIEEFQTLMRSNNYKSDELYKNQPNLALSARMDLMPEKPELYGATDAKVGTSLAPEKVKLIGGPTYTSDCPVFKFVESKDSPRDAQYYQGVPYGIRF